MAAPPSNTQVASDLLERAHSPDTTETILLERVKQRPLLLRPTSPDPQQNARSKRQYARLQKERARRRSNKPKPLSARQKRALCLYDIPKHLQKFAIYEPLHRMWCGYMREILGMEEGRNKHIDGQTSGPILASADYHGALVEIVRSRCVSRVGLRGIVAKDTKFTFEIVTPANELKVVPKEHTVFRIEVPWVDEEDEKEASKRDSLVFEIYGSQFETRAPDRANKKFRFHYDPEL